MRKAARNNGFAIILVLIAVAVAVVIGTSYVSSAAIKTAGSRNFLKAARAKYLAESGIQHAMHLLWTDPSALMSTSANNPLGPYAADNTSARYTLWSTPDAYEIGLYHVTARAASDGMSQDVTWQVYRTPPYDRVVMATNPRGYWRLGDPRWSILADDAMDADYDLICCNGVWANLGIEGAINGTDTAIRFDGWDDYLYRPPTSALQMKTDLTISLWFQIDRLPTSSNKSILLTCSEDSEQTNKNALYQLAINSSGELEYLHEYNSGRDQSKVFHEAAFSTGSWHNLVVTRDWATSAVKVYLEGQLVATWVFHNPGAPKPNSGKRSGLYIGSAWGDESFFKGRMDELALLDRVLSDAEIQTLHEVGGMEEKLEVRSCGN